MTAEMCCVHPEDTIATAAGLMRQHAIGALPVWDNDHVAGMVTDRDIAVRGVAAACDPEATPVRMVMSSEIIYTFDDQDVQEAARIMELNQVRRLPVLDRAQHLVGIVSLGDVAREAGDRLSGEALREISQPGPANSLSNRNLRPET